MTGSEVQAAYFTPFHFIIYLIIIFGIMVAYYQWTWTKKCNRYIKVLSVKADGDTITEYAPKVGGYVALRSSPESNTTRWWPINKLSTIEELYPGDGFIPVFLQKKIKTVIVSDEDWEPLLNRGPYTRDVASPDVRDMIRDWAEDMKAESPEISSEMNTFADGLKTASTRELVASPAVLGNLMEERITEIAVTISKETLDQMAGFAKRMEKMPNATILYIGLGVIGVLLAIIVIRFLPVLSGLGGLVDGINAIKQALGIP